MDGFYNNWPNGDRVLVNYVVNLDTSNGEPIQFGLVQNTYAKMLVSIGICF